MSHTPPQSDATSSEPKVYGVIAEFDDVNDVMLAAREVRDAGYERWDVHSPFPIHGIDPAIGIRPTILPWIVLACGLTGLGAGLFLTVWTMSGTLGLPSPWGELRPYQFLISGKPLDSLPAYMPVIFELTILLAAFGGVFGMFLLNRLPLLSHPLLSHEKMRRATDDRFFIVIESRDKQFDTEQTAKLFESFSPLSLEMVSEIEPCVPSTEVPQPKSSHH